MLIKTLVENTSLSNNFGSEHGLSLYIETNNQKILFDAGAGDLFLHNAKKLDVDIADIDYLVISHGHYDHGGGLKAFLEENSKAKVFLHPLAFENYYVIRSNGKLDFIGLDSSLKEEKQVVFTSNHFFISNEIQLFSNVVQKETRPKSNNGLFTEHKGQKIDDTFAHEQNLLIEEDGKTLLATGCAHNGIINIIEHFYMLQGIMPNYVIGGFHLSSRSGANEEPDKIDRLGKYLLNTGAMYYTCHCTGIDAYESLKLIMGSSIDYLSSGSEVTI